jgi:hypothetical protein
MADWYAECHSCCVPFIRSVTK